MRPVTLALVLLLASAAHAQTGVPEFEGTFAVPYLACDCDPEYLHFRTLEPLAGRAEPRLASPQVRAVDVNRRIEVNDWDDVITVTVQPGRYVALRDVTLDGLTGYGTTRLLGPSVRGHRVEPLAVRAGQTVEAMLWDERGTLTFRFEGSVYAFGDGGLPDGAFRETQQRVEEIWMHLTAKPGKPAAWVELRMWGESGVGNNVEMSDGTDY